ncbi:dsDNA nuclease domain-containing protein [Undibacterium sp. TC9W]|uniref:dsDNA nuclease domain-containing protein n=1 Tax=Undibacterium sp. TC9W TaxID=3413053 RepID=UPI003BF22431
MKLHENSPREQNGRDSFARYKAQVRSAAIAALAILEAKEIDRVYCDLHDDFVIRKTTPTKTTYVFTQVKTRAKQNQNWTINDLIGLSVKIKDQSKQDTAKIKDSFVGKLLAHTVVFGESCQEVVFQTNANLDDAVIDLFDEMSVDNFSSKYATVLINRFNECFSNELKCKTLSIDDIKSCLRKIVFETDIQHLKGQNTNFDETVRKKIYEFSEVDLLPSELDQLLLKLLDLVEKKSAGIITEISEESFELLASISVSDLLEILSISRQAYDLLIQGEDAKAIKSVSMIQRALTKAGGQAESVEYCSRCKIKWDTWVRKNRLHIPPLDMNSITQLVSELLIENVRYDGIVLLSNLRKPIKSLITRLESEDILFDLDTDTILGGFFSELIKGRS